MAHWLWPVAGLLVVAGLLALGARVTRYKHEAMVALALGEVFRLDGDPARARRFYEAARHRPVKLPEADAAIAALDAGSREPLVDHPLVDDMRRRLATERERLDEWLERRGLPRTDAGPGPAAQALGPPTP